MWGSRDSSWLAAALACALVTGRGKQHGQETVRELEGLRFVLWPSASSIDKLEEMTSTTF